MAMMRRIFPMGETKFGRGFRFTLRCVFWQAAFYMKNGWIIFEGKRFVRSLDSEQFLYPPVRPSRFAW